MTIATIEEQKRKKAEEFMKSIQSYAGDLLKGATVSVMSPFLLHCEMIFTMKGDVGSGDLLIHYDVENQDLRFKMRLSEIVPNEHIERAIKFINLINIESSCVQYAILQESGEVTVSLNIFLAQNLPSRDKIEKAILLLINNSTISSLLLHWLSTQDLSPEELHNFYLNFQFNVYPDSSRMTKIYKDRTLNTIVDYFRESAGCKPLNENYLKDGGLVFDLYITEGLAGRMLIEINEVLEEISLRLTPMAVVPEERTEELMKLLASLNVLSSINHLTFDPKDRWVVLNSGILLDDGVLHRQELRMTVGSMLGNAFLYLPLIAEFMNSNISQKEIIRRLQTEVFPNVDMKYRHNIFE